MSGGANLLRIVIVFLCTPVLFNGKDEIMIVAQCFGGNNNRNNPSAHIVCLRGIKEFEIMS